MSPTHLRKLIVLLLSACVLLTDAAAQEQHFGCERDEFARKFNRAWDAREDHFFWEDLDQEESLADLDRYLGRLTEIVRKGGRCSDLVIGGLVEQARRQLSGFESVRGKRDLYSVPDPRRR